MPRWIAYISSLGGNDMWDDLTVDQKAKWIAFFAQNGIYKRSEVKEKYNLLQRVNKSDADFVQRLKDPNRAYIRDWENPDNIATHKMSWADDGVVYSQVQNKNGQLEDYSRPPYSIWVGYDNAVRNGDTIHMTPEEAEWFTTHYKNFYPGFNEYNKGGSIQIKPKKYILQGKKYYQNGGVVEGEFDVNDISKDEIQELNRLGFEVDII